MLFVYNATKVGKFGETASGVIAHRQGFLDDCFLIADEAICGSIKCNPAFLITTQAGNLSLPAVSIVSLQKRSTGVVENQILTLYIRRNGSNVDPAGAYDLFRRIAGCEHDLFTFSAVGQYVGICSRGSLERCRNVPARRSAQTGVVADGTRLFFSNVFPE